MLDTLKDNYNDPNPKKKKKKKKVKLISVCGGSINGLDPCSAIEKVTEEFNKDNKSETAATEAYMVSISKDTWNLINPRIQLWSPYNGCDAHYGVKGHEVLANTIVDDVKKILIN